MNAKTLSIAYAVLTALLITVLVPILVSTVFGFGRRLLAFYTFIVFLTLLLGMIVAYAYSKENIPKIGYVMSGIAINIITLIVCTYYLFHI